MEGVLIGKDLRGALSLTDLRSVRAGAFFALAAARYFDDDFAAMLWTDRNEQCLEVVRLEAGWASGLTVGTGGDAASKAWFTSGTSARQGRLSLPHGGIALTSSRVEDRVDSFFVGRVVGLADLDDV